MTVQQPRAKFEVGQVVAIKSLKKQMVFRILAVQLFDGEWAYQLNRKNWLSEHMLRPLTEQERGSHGE